MPAREQHHAPGRGRRRFWRRLGWFLVVVLLVTGSLAVGQWRYGALDDAARRIGLEQHADAPRRDVLRLPVPVRVRQVAAAGTAGDPSAAKVARALAPYVDAHALGKHVDVLVTALDGRTLFQRGKGAVRPASTMKLLTTTAALQSLGPATRFATTVRRSPSGREVVLVGGGDPFLASTAKVAAGLYPARATTADLARRTARVLRADGIHRVHLAYDASLFTGPAVDPAWPATYISEDVVPPISALWVNEGQDGSGGYVADPARSAAGVFAKQLRASGVEVTGAVHSTTTPSGWRRVAEVSSAPLGEIVQRTLAVSDNNAAEVIARHVGLAVQGKGSFAGATHSVRAVLARLGIPLAGLVIHDGSGLSRADRVLPRTLVDALRLDASATRPRLSDVVAGLPVAGFTGSLAARYGQAPAAGRGRVRAKTGTLTGVSALAGVATDLDGDTLVFAVMADRIVPADTLEARAALDDITAALGACHCASTGSGSGTGTTP